MTFKGSLFGILNHEVIIMQLETNPKISKNFKFFKWTFNISQNGRKTVGIRFKMSKRQPWRKDVKETTSAGLIRIKWPFSAINGTFIVSDKNHNCWAKILKLRNLKIIICLTSTLMGSLEFQYNLWIVLRRSCGFKADQF